MSKKKNDRNSIECYVKQTPFIHPNECAKYGVMKVDKAVSKGDYVELGNGVMIAMEDYKAGDYATLTLPAVYQFKVASDSKAIKKNAAVYLVTDTGEVTAYKTDSAPNIIGVAAAAAKAGEEVVVNIGNPEASTLRRKYEHSLRVSWEEESDNTAYLYCKFISDSSTCIDIHSESSSIDMAVIQFINYVIAQLVEYDTKTEPFINASGGYVSEKGAKTQTIVGVSWHLLYGTPNCKLYFLGGLSETNQIVFDSSILKTLNVEDSVIALS